MPDDGFGSHRMLLLRHPALADQPEAARQLADDLELGRRDRRPLPRPDADLGPLPRVEGVLLPRLGRSSYDGRPTNQPGGLASWRSFQASSRSVGIDASCRSWPCDPPSVGPTRVCHARARGQLRRTTTKVVRP